MSRYDWLERPIDPDDNLIIKDENGVAITTIHPKLDSISRLNGGDLG